MSGVAMAIIDGTGAWSNDSYASSMRESFCKQLDRLLGPNSLYERGPSGDGYRIRERSARAADFLSHQRGKRLMLAGYSRGGSAAVIAASMLGNVGVGVDFLFLFDPVARHLSGSSDVVPGNVGEVWIARRRIGAPEMDRYDYSLLGDPAGHNPVRNWFGTTATDVASGVRVTAEDFLGSHGALGGVGWKHVREDSQCQMQVADYMNRGLTRAGLGVMLVPVPPNTES